MTGVSGRKSSTKQRFNSISVRKASQKANFKKTTTTLNLQKFKGLMEKKDAFKKQGTLDLDKMNQIGEFSAQIIQKRQ